MVDNLTELSTTSHGERVKASILEEGLKLWRVDPASVSARAIAQQLGVTHGAILYHFGTSFAMRSAIAAEAVRIADPVIVPMLIAAKHSAVASMARADRQSFLADC